MSSSPYDGLPPEAFWRTGVAGPSPGQLDNIYKPKVEIPKDCNIVTAGSCFAQHIAIHLRQSGYRVMDAEPAPANLSKELAKKFGYGLYSARYGNIYTARALVQLMDEARGRFTPGFPVWERSGRFYDAMRPNVEPMGFDSEEEVLMHRARHLRAVRGLFRGADILVFTLGLTEAWVDEQSNTVYPTAPGTIADPPGAASITFKNYNAQEVVADLVAVRKRLRAANPNAKMLLTVSPVPLTATASGQHVLYATTYSKAVLRAAAGEFFEMHDDVDYFPSYEIVTNPANRSSFYDENLRSVKIHGVETVMRTFLASHTAEARNDAAVGSAVGVSDNRREDDLEDDVVCEELLLEAFANA